MISLLFLILSSIIYFIYPIFVYKPKNNSMTKQQANYVAMINGVISYFVIRVLYVLVSSIFVVGDVTILGVGLAYWINYVSLKKKYVHIDEYHKKVAYNPVFKEPVFIEKFDMRYSLELSHTEMQEKGKLYFKLNDRIYSKEKFIYERYEFLKIYSVEELIFYKKSILKYASINSKSALCICELEAIEKILIEKKKKKKKK